MQDVIRLDLGGVNAYLLKKEEKFVLVDTGGHMFLDKVLDNRRDRLKKGLAEHGVTRDNLAWVILTHGDIDHVCNAKYIKEEFGARIAMQEQDLALVKDPPADCYRWNAHYRSIVMNLVFRLMDRKLAKLMGHIYEKFESFEPDCFLKDGDSMEKFGMEGKILGLPGHTPGSLGIIWGDGQLIAGDILANLSKPSQGVNAQDFKQMLESVDKIRNHNVSMVYPGHGKPFRMELLGGKQRAI